MKAIELKPNGSKGFKVVGLRLGIDSARHDCRWRGHRRCHVADAIRRIFDTKRFKAKDVVASLSGNAVIVKKIALAGDDRCGARRFDPLGGGAVHPIRHPGRPSRLPGARSRRQRSRQADDGRAAGGGEEGQDRRLHRRDFPGGQDRGDRRRRRLRGPELLRGELRRRAGRDGASQRRRLRDQRQHCARRPVALHARHLDRRQRLHRGDSKGIRPRRSRPPSTPSKASSPTV